MSEPKLKEDAEIYAAFNDMVRSYPDLRSVMADLGAAAREACRQCFRVGFTDGQADALRYHIEMMKRHEQ